MARLKRLGIRVDAKMHRRLAELAKKSGASRAELVRRVLAKHLR